MRVERIDDFRWRIPKEPPMRVEGLVFADATLLEKMRDEKALEQVRNVACLPGLVGPSIGMPDLHWGYGFPIGGVAAFDPDHGVISPGGVGYDINCLEGATPVLFADGTTRPIRDVVEEEIRESVTSVATASRRPASSPVVAGLARRPGTVAWEVVTEAGRRIVATADHPFLTPTGMRALGQIAIGDRVAVLPFDGVPFEAPSSAVLVTQRDLDRTARRLGVPTRTCPLLPLAPNHPAMPALVRLVGLVLGDGSVSFDRRSGKGRVSLVGRREDLEAVVRTLRPWLPATAIHARHRHHRIRTTYGERTFEATEHSVDFNVNGAALLLVTIGLPVGARASQDWTVPRAIRRLPRWQQRIFLAAFFGAELTTPDAFARRNRNFKCPVLTVVKRDAFVESGRRFLRELARMLAPFGVRALCVSRRDEQSNPDGSRSVRLRLILSSALDSLIALYTRVGFEGNRHRQSEGLRCGAYLQAKRTALAARDAARRRILELRAVARWGATKIHAAMGAEGAVVNQRFVERTIYGRSERTLRSAAAFPTFRAWVRGRAFGADGAMLETVVARVRRPDVRRVYDITVDHPSHTFVASGFIVHNCGVRLLASDLPADAVAAKRARLADALNREVPSGVGAARDDLVLSPAELERCLVEGAAFAVGKGMGDASDLEHTEEGGVLAGARPDLVSALAKTRGAGQLGTLGSGNHFLEVDRVAEVYDEVAAKALGIAAGATCVLIHCGSRGLGHQVCTDALPVMRRAAAEHGIELRDPQLACAPFRSPEGQHYFGAMRAAVNFAFANRQVIADRVRRAFRAVLGPQARLRQVYDVCHNIAKLERHLVHGKEREVVVHRKGATRAFPPGHPLTPAAYRDVGQPVLVPGDMGRYSFVLVGTEGAWRETFGSCCHGAGRLQSRTKAQAAVKGHHVARELEARGIAVRASSRRTIDEEHPGAYKDVADVVAVVTGAGLARLVARLEPFAVVKG